MNDQVKRAISPVTNPAGWMAGAAALYAVITAIIGHQHIRPDTWVAAIAFVATLLVRSRVTPVADPRNSAGEHLSTCKAGPENVPGASSA